MTTQKTKAPNPLPKTIPAGTRFDSGKETAVAAGEMRLSYAHYCGPIVFTTRGANNEYPEGSFTAAHVDWSSVPAESNPRFEVGMRVRMTRKPYLDRAGREHDSFCYAAGDELVLKAREPLQDSGSYDGLAWLAIGQSGGAIVREGHIEPITEPDSKPFRSLADQYRDEGRCECCGARPVDQGIDGLADLVEFKVRDLRGAGFSDECARRHASYKGVAEMGERIRKNRSTPATEGVKPVEESDEAWLKRVVFELTGIDAKVIPDTSDANGDLMVQHPDHFTLYYRMPDRGRRVEQVRDKLADTANKRSGWPMKGSAGVGSAKPLDAAAAREPASAPEPTSAEATRYCAECGERADTERCRFVGIDTPLCAAHVARRCDMLDQGKADPFARKPCGDGCICAYCVHASGATVKASRDRQHRHQTDNPSDFTRGKEVDACRARLAALEARERRSNAPSSAERKMLDGGKAALRHWPSVSEYEP